MAINFDTITNFFLGSALSKLSANFDKVSSEFDKVVRRDGSNVMQGDLDMNGRRVINSGTPIDDNDLASIAQVREYTSSITQGPPGTSDNTYTTYAALLASPLERRSARLVGDPVEPDGIFSSRSGQWVRQQADSIVFKQPASASTQTLQAKLARLVDVDDYRYAADFDDTNAFIRAVAALASTGGEIRLDPKKRYLVSGQIEVKSLFHIKFIGGNFGQVYDANGPGIAITLPLSALFRVQAPGTNRSACGGASFSGISFYDATGGGGLPGTNQIGRALLDMYDAPLSMIQNCQFHFIKGSVIRGDFFVQSSIVGCRIRYCGDTNKKVVHLGSTSTSYASQSVTVYDTRMEVCYGDSYLYSDANTQSITASFVKFEAAPTEFPGSSIPYLDLAGDDYKVVACGFNRNLSQAVILRGRGIVTGCSFVTGPSISESLLLLGARHVITGNAFTDTRTSYSIRATGVLNTISSNSFYASGGILLEGANNKFNDNIIDSPTMTGGGYVLALADYCTATGNDFNSYDFSGSGYVPAVNGAALYGINSTFANNTCRGWAGKTFIRIENASAVFQPNTHDGVGTFASTGVQLNMVPSASTLILPNNSSVVTITGTTTINELGAGPQWAGREVTLVFAGALTVNNTNNLKLNTSYVSSSNDTLTLACDGQNWYEMSRSVN